MAGVIGPGWYMRDVNLGSTATGTTSLVLSKPTGTIDGDILICGFTHKGSAYATMPAGWTVIDRVLSGATRVEMHWKRASGEGASYTITGLATAAAGGIQAYGGGLTAGNVVHAVASATAAAGTSAQVASFPVTIERALMVSTVGNAANDFVFEIQCASAYSGSFALGLPPDGNIQRFTLNPIAQTTDLEHRMGAAQKVKASSTGIIRSNPSSGQFSAENGIIVAALIPDEATVVSGTRYYLALKQPDRRIDGALHGGWTGTFTSPYDYGEITTPLRLSQTKSDVGAIIRLRAYANTPNTSTLMYYAMTPPLEAQTIAGTVDFCTLAASTLINNTTGNAPVDVFWKLHLYISTGQTTTVRHTLLHQYVDATALPYLVASARALTAPTALTSGACLAGDSIVCECGLAFGTFTTPTPTRAPSHYARADLTVAGAQSVPQASGSPCFGPAYPDMVAGVTTDPKSTPWLQFTADIVEQTPGVTVYTNTTLATAAVIASLPFRYGPVSTVDMPAPMADLWWSWTATFDGTVFWHAIESTYPVDLSVWDTVGGHNVSTSNRELSRMNGPGMCTSGLEFACVSGTTYYLRAYLRDPGAGPSCGGSLVVSLIQRLPLADGDLILPMASLGFSRWRDGVLVALTYGVLGSWTGMAIDYTRRVLYDFDTNPHTDYRAYVCDFANRLITIRDLETFEEIDYIADPLDMTSSLNWETGAPKSLAQLAMSRAGMLYIGYWGNGFLYVATSAGTSTTLVSFQNVAATTDSSSLLVLDGLHADSQPDAPFPSATRYNLAQPFSGAGYLSIDELDADVITYASGGTYRPTGANTVLQYSLAGGQLATLATLTPTTSPMPDVRANCPLPGGGWLVCNGSQIVRIDASGTVTQTYTPAATSPNLSRTFIDVKLTVDGTGFWALDCDTHSLFKFALTGAQVQGFRTYMGSGNVVQMALFAIEPPPPPPPPEPSPIYETTTLMTRRLRRASHLTDEHRWLTYDKFQVDLQAGVGLTDGQGEDPQVMVRWSNDGGHTWSNEHWTTAGRQGARKTRVIVRQTGRARVRTFEIVVSDPVAWCLAAAYLDVTPGNGS